jgi:hypothetical protein
MGLWKGLFLGGAIALGAIGAGMALTKPTPEQFNTYATDQLVIYLSESFCADLPNFFGRDLQGQCVDLVEERRPQLAESIAENTERRDFVVLNHYHTNLRPEDLLPDDVRSFVPAGMLPAYEVSTVGAFQQFWVYRARQQR